MRPPIQVRFSKEDYQEAPNWFGRFLQPLNQFIEQTVQVLSRNVSLGDNIQARVFTTSYTTDAAYATGTFEPIRFSWGGASFPAVVLVSNVTRDDGAVQLTSVGTPTWRFNDGSVVITYVPGLAASTKYSLTFLVI